MHSKRNRKKEGVLYVKLSTRTALGKAWKRKWIVVQQNTSSSGKSLLLELYVEKGAYHKTVTSLLLQDVVGVKRTRSKTQEHAIEISSASKVLLGVGAESETEAQEWLGMFHANLLPPVKEMASPPGIPEGFVRVSVMPNKDSERASLSGDYYAHVSLTHINLYDTCTGKISLDWDLRHLKKFMLISKSHALDVEKIVHILTSKRSVSGEGEFIFYSPKGKELVEGLYERMSTAMTVKSRRSRSTSMLFEITPQELEQMFKEGEQSPEDTLKEDAEQEEAEAGAEKEGEVNGSIPVDVAGSNGVEANKKETHVVLEVPSEVFEQPPDEKQEGGVQEDEKQDENLLSETLEQPDGTPEVEDRHEGEILNGEDAGDTAPDAKLTDVAQELHNGSPQDEIVKDSAETDERITEDATEEDNKCNQTNTEEMDGGLEASTSPTEEATPTDVTISGPGLHEYPDSGLTQGDKACVSVEPQECTPDSGADMEQDEQSAETTSAIGPKGDQSQESSGVSVAVDNVIIVPNIENRQETEVPDQAQPAISANIQESTEPPKDDEEKEAPPAVDGPTAEDQLEHTEADKEHTTISEEPVSSDVKETPEADAEHETTTEEQSDKNIQETSEVATEDVIATEEIKELIVEEQPNKNERETTITDIEHDTTYEEQSKTDTQQTTVADNEHGETYEEQTNKATVEQSTPLVEHEQESTSLELSHQNEPEVPMETSSEKVKAETPDASISNEIPTKTEDAADDKLEPTNTEVITNSPVEVSEESKLEHPSVDHETAPTAMPDTEEPKPASCTQEGDENTNEDTLNSNQNNSNADAAAVRKVSKTMPLPNSLTSMMASALRNAHKRKVSSTASPSQETQTEFPAESHDADDASEIIV